MRFLITVQLLTVPNQPSVEGSATRDNEADPTSPQAIITHINDPLLKIQFDADVKIAAAETQCLDATTIAERTSAREMVRRFPNEVVCLIWRAHIDNGLAQLRVRTGYAKVDDTEVDSEGKRRTTSHFKLEYDEELHRVTEKPINLIFSTSLTNDPHLFRDFFLEAARLVTFHFKSTTAITQFAKVLRRYFLPKTLPGGIRLSVNLFSGEEYIPMSDWASTLFAHGIKFEAHEHVEDYVNAVRILAADIDPSSSRGVTTELTLHRPWRDYDYLRGVTAPLRDNKDNVRVRLPQPYLRAWAQIEDPQLHIALAIVSVMGTRMEKRQDEFTHSQAERLVRYGCRGFKG